jgi:hypothetical protein
VSCRKVFAKPLNTINFRQQPSEPYAACPYCLTKITETKITSSYKPEKTHTEIISTKEKTENKNQEKPSACQYHLGYLSERERNPEIPEICIVCKDIVECMLRRMRA